jgi:exoribonuclease-2
MKNHSTTSDSLDLAAIAHQAMIDAGFVADLPQAVSDELRDIESTGQSSDAHSEARDMRALLWSSIDNRESRDLDQVECAEACPTATFA